MLTAFIFSVALVSSSIFGATDGDLYRWDGRSQSSDQTFVVSVTKTERVNAGRSGSSHLRRYGGAVSAGVGLRSASVGSVPDLSPQQKLALEFARQWHKDQEQRLSDRAARGENPTMGDILTLPSLPNTSTPTPAPTSSPVVPVALDKLVTTSDVAALGVEAGGVQIQPARGWAFINKPVYLEATAEEIVQSVVLAGMDVTIRARPVSYTWDMGDGTVLTTKDAGGSWPDGTVTHTYAAPAQGCVISVTTTWQASYTVGGVTYPVPGTLTRTAHSAPFDLREAEAVLVQ